MSDNDDRRAVAELLGRHPEAQFEVVARDEQGSPRVIRNEPFLDDGTPMPTRYWLVGRDDVRAVSQLESAGGVAEAEAAVDPDEIAAAHDRYARERDEAVRRLGVSGPAPSGGVGGTRRGVKCLHAHFAWHLAGGDDPVGRWVADRLSPSAGLDIAVHDAATTFRQGGTTLTVPIGPSSLIAATAHDAGPPDPAALTNALGLVADHIDDVVRAQPGVVDSRQVRVAGAEPWHLVAVERGRPDVEAPALLERSAAEEVFRLLATETRAERLHNPALDPTRVDTVLGTCCLLLGLMRRLQLDQIAVSPADAA